MTPERSERKTEFEREALVHLDALYGLALRLTGGDEAGSEDLVREAVVEAYRSWDTYEVGTNCRAWLMTILRNAFVDELRRRKERPTPVEHDDVAGREPAGGRSLLAGVEDRGPEGELLHRIADEEVADAVESLPVEFRLPLVLSDLEGLSYRETADALEVAEATVGSRLHRARRRLQQRLRDHAVETGTRHGPRERRVSPGRRRNGTGSDGDGPPGDLTCEEALARGYEYLDGELDPHLQERMHRHLEACRACHPCFDVERLFLDDLHDRGLSARENPSLRARVEALLDEIG